MSVWQRLGIDATDDQRAIKRAYAAQLKITRPDEKPAEFQALHEAYQHALAIANNQRATASAADVAASGPDEPVPVADTGNDVGEEPASAPESEEAAEPQPDPYGIEGNRLLDQVDVLLVNSSARADVANWRFLESCPYMFDSDFSWRLGLFIFKRLEVCYRDDMRMQVDTEPEYRVLHYLDELFSWRVHEMYLRRALGDESADILLSRIGASSGRRNESSEQWLRGSRGVRKILDASVYEAFHAQLGDRGMAVIFDTMLVISALVVAAINGLEFRWFYIIGGYSLLAWFFQSSFLMATPAMWLMGLKISNRQYERLSYRQALMVQVKVFGTISIIILAGALLVMGAAWVIEALGENGRVLLALLFFGIPLILRGHDLSGLRDRFIAARKRFITWRVINHRGLKKALKKEKMEKAFR